MGRYSKAAKEAANLTNKQLATEMAALAPFNRDQLQILLPKKRDKEAFLALMRVVEDETDMDEKLAYLRNNIKKAGEVIFKVLQVFL